MAAGINVLEESAGNAIIRTERADALAKAVGQVVAGVGLDRDLLAVPAESTVNAEVDVSEGLLDRKVRQCLDFTVVGVDARANIERVAGTTYRL